MGRKSAAKKNRRTKESGKPPKQTLKEKFLTEIRRKKFAQRKIIGTVLIVIGTIFVVSIGITVFGRLAQPESIAKFVPEEQVVAILTLNANLGSQEIKNFFHLMQDYPMYSFEKIKELSNTWLHRNFEKDIKPWLGKAVGIAVLKEGKSWTPILFLHVKDRGKSTDFIKTFSVKDDELTTENIEGLDVFTFKISHDLVFGYVSDFLFIAKNKEIASLIAKTVNRKTKSLFETEKFHRIIDNLPSRNLTFVYLDFPNMLSMLVANETYMKEKGISLLLFQPLLQKIESFGGILNAQENMLAVQTLLKLKPKWSKESVFRIFDDKYTAELAKMFPQNVKIFFGGRDMEKQLNKLIEILSDENGKTKKVLELALLNQKDKFFSERVSLENDIYPLLKQEYAISLHGDKNTISFAVKLSEPAQDRIRIEKLINGFKNSQILSKPHIREVKLPDGSIGREVVGSTDKVEETSAKYENIDIRSLKLGSNNISIHYAIIGDVLFLSTSLETVQSAIKPEKTFAETNIFRETMSKIMRSVDEITYIDFDEVKKWIPIQPAWEPYLEPLKAISSGKNFFEDGISSIHFILIKKASGSST